MYLPLLKILREFPSTLNCLLWPSSFLRWVVAFAVGPCALSVYRPPFRRHCSWVNQVCLNVSSSQSPSMTTWSKITRKVIPSYFASHKLKHRSLHLFSLVFFFFSTLKCQLHDGRFFASLAHVYIVSAGNIISFTPQICAEWMMPVVRYMGMLLGSIQKI